MRAHVRRLLRWCAAMACVAAAAAHAQQAAEPAVKAAFLYKFAGYVEWPPATFASPETPFVIGVAGNDAVAAELERLVPGRAIHQRPVQVRRLGDDAPLDGVHLLFIGRNAAAPRTMLRAARQQSVLAVTETEQGLDWGSAINFVSLGDRVGFEVSLDSAEKSGLRISSRMLAVARRVVPGS